ncbi:hypothetical protein GF406_05070 [candidate division KSB1 bacterium]|nr:hypothetical protein [candidate division KSB1 bacterium]
MKRVKFFASADTEWNYGGLNCRRLRQAWPVGAYASDSATAERTDKKDILSFLPGRCGTFTQVLG